MTKSEHLRKRLSHLGQALGYLDALGEEADSAQWDLEGLEPLHNELVAGLESLRTLLDAEARLAEEES